MKLTKFILVLIAGLAIMGFNTMGFAETGAPGEYYLEELESESDAMEEDKYLVDEETVKPVKREAWDEERDI